MNICSYRIQVKNIVQEFSTTIVTVFPEYSWLMKYIETCVIFSKHMGPAKWRRSFTTTHGTPLTETKAEMFPKMSMYNVFTRFRTKEGVYLVLYNFKPPKLLQETTWPRATARTRMMRVQNSSSMTVKVPPLNYRASKR